MFFIRTLLFIFTGMVCLGQTPAPPEVVRDLRGPEIFKLGEGTVFKLSTRLAGSNSERSHGTAFVVSSEGYAITNYHVVADALEEPDKYELALSVGGAQVLAEVLHIDPVNDIALVKVRTKFTNFLTIAKDFNSEMGETLFSLGFPASEEVSMIQGTFNGQRMMGFAIVTAA